MPASSRDPASLQRASAAERGHHAASVLAALFRRRGWRVVREPSVSAGPRPDLLVSRPGASYMVEIKAAPEGRGDRLIPLWAQASLQAARAAGDKHAPLAVVVAPRIAPSVADHILEFAAEYAPNTAAGVIDFEGLRRFRGPHLESLNAAAAPPISSPLAKRPGGQALFSDLNQWMLKVLLAPELPDSLLSAPRGQYRNSSQLAGAANVSVMSAFRLVQQLQLEGYLHESDPYLNLVRREHLFSRWQAAALGRVEEEAPMRFLLRGNPQSQLRPILQSGRACLGLFAAADVLGLGFVSGVPPYVYVQRLKPANLAAWKNLVPAAPGESPDLIMRRAHAAQSMFRGIVRPNGIASCDALQVWLDVSGHPARGQEQADLIRRRVLEPLISGRHPRG
jgi:hypothetical protein